MAAGLPLTLKEAGHEAHCSALLLAAAALVLALAAPAARAAGHRRPRRQRHASRSRRSASSALLPSLTETRVRARPVPAPGRRGPLFQLPGQRAAACRGWAAGMDPNIEAIVALKPDVVLLATSSRAQRSGWSRWASRCVALEPKSHADVQRVLGKLGQLLDVPDAAPSASGAPSTPACRRPRSRCRRRARHARVFRGQPRAVCGRRGLVHRRNADAAGRAATSCRPRWGRFPSSTPNSWCAPTPT